MISYHCDLCDAKVCFYVKELDNFYCYSCENYCNARAKKWE